MSGADAGAIYDGPPTRLRARAAWGTANRSTGNLDRAARAKARSEQREREARATGWEQHLWERQGCLWIGLRSATAQRPLATFEGGWEGR